MYKGYSSAVGTGTQWRFAIKAFTYILCTLFIWSYAIIVSKQDCHHHPLTLISWLFGVGAVCGLLSFCFIICHFIIYFFLFHVLLHTVQPSLRRASSAFPSINSNIHNLFPYVRSFSTDTFVGLSVFLLLALLWNSL